MVVFLCSAGIAGCVRARADAASDVRLAWTLLPSPPSAGPATLQLVLTDHLGRPVEGARLRVEGNMSHPGMAPVFAGLDDGAAGHYRARLTLTMGGDWVFTVTGTVPGGRALERRIDVNNVQSTR